MSQTFACSFIMMVFRECSVITVVFRECSLIIVVFRELSEIFLVFLIPWKVGKHCSSLCMVNYSKRPQRTGKNNSQQPKAQEHSLHRPILRIHLVHCSGYYTVLIMIIIGSFTQFAGLCSDTRKMWLFFALLSVGMTTTLGSWATGPQQKRWSWISLVQRWHVVIHRKM